MDGEGPGQEHRPVSFALNADRVAVELVIDLPDQLLEQVLHGHDALGAAVLVDHNGQGLAFALEPTQGVQNPDRLGQGQRRPNMVGHAAAGVDQVDQVGHPDHVVQVAPVDRRPAMGGRHQRPDRVLNWRVGGHGDHLATWHQHVAQDPLGEPQRADQDGAVLGAEAGLGGDQVADLLLGDRLALDVGVAPGQADQQVGGVGQQPHRRLGQGGDQGEGTGGAFGPGFGSLQGDAFGGQLPDDQGQVGKDQGDQDHGHRLGRPAQEPQQGDQRFGQGDRGRRRGQEPGQGDADLDGGQELVGVVGQPGDQPPPPALVFQAPQLPFAQRDQGDLAAGKGGVDHHQHQHQPDLSPRYRHASSPSSTAVPGPANHPQGCSWPGSYPDFAVGALLSPVAASPVPGASHDPKQPENEHDQQDRHHQGQLKQRPPGGRSWHPQLLSAGHEAGTSKAQRSQSR